MRVGEYPKKEKQASKVHMDSGPGPGLPTQIPPQSQVPNEVLENVKKNAPKWGSMG